MCAIRTIARIMIWNVSSIVRQQALEFKEQLLTLSKLLAGLWVCGQRETTSVALSWPKMPIRQGDSRSG